MFSRTLRWKSKFSCSTTPTWPAQLARRPSSAMSVPSTSTRPLSGT
jgi:hypothetical protein